MSALVVEFLKQPLMVKSSVHLGTLFVPFICPIFHDVKNWFNLPKVIENSLKFHKGIIKRVYK